jgi:eukaryotic-like serine/threonine-protein kinase
VNPERWQEIKIALHRALELQGAPRLAYIDGITADDADLRSELVSLIAAHEGSADSFLDVPAAVMHADAETAYLQADSRIGNYRLICEIGQGGMGQVWLAEQMAPVRRLVALKLIRAGMYDETVAHRFQAERQSLAIMDHPAIAKVFDAGSTPQGQPYFVMEYVPGLPITEYCDHKRLKIRDRLELFIQACEGVQHAHQKAIIHRDLKPANILIVEVDGKPVPRIIDFGLAKTATPRKADETLYTQYGQFIGTPGFMSPEQIDPEVKDIDTRTDVYSLGVILYVLLAGQQPFETKGQRPPLDRWLRRLREEEPPSLSAKLSEDREAADAIAAARSTERKQLVSLMRGDLEWITGKALERERERRYGTPSELAADLRRYVNHEPVMARPASASYQIRKFVRRHRVAAVAVAFVSILAVVASIFGLIAVRQKHEAQYQAGQALRAQSRLLTQAAAQRIKDSDVAGAGAIILEVLTNPVFAFEHTPAAISVFQEVRAADTQQAVLAGHGAPLYTAAYSPDGTHIVTASVDKSARIWDVRTGIQVAVLLGHTERVTSAVYSPDGTRIITASFDKSMRIWDARTGAQLAVLSNSGDRVYKATYSPDGTRIVTASPDKSARIFNASTGAELAVLAGHLDRVTYVAYSPDGTRIVTSSFDKTARIWDSHTGKQLVMLSGHIDRLFLAEFSPDGTRIVTASFDKTARIWDARTGAQLLVLATLPGAIYSARYSPDGTRIVTASDDKTARIWDATTGTLLAVLSGHVDTIQSAAFSPDGKHIVTASSDRTARIWGSRTTAWLGQLSGHEGTVKAAAFSPDGSRIVTGSFDKTVRLWDAKSDAQLALLAGHADAVLFVGYSPDGTRILSASLDKTGRVWDAHTGAQLGIISSASSMAVYSPDGSRILTVADKSAKIWDARTNTLLAVLSGHENNVGSGVYSPDGSRIVTASQDKTARIWDARSGTQLMVLLGHDNMIYTAAYSPDGTRIVTASHDATVRIWDANSGEQLSLLSGHHGPVDSAVYSPDGRFILSASDDKTARIWNASTGVQLAVLAGHSEDLASAAYSPDGQRIVTTSEDRTAQIWDARIPADVPDQIMWSASAETDLLTEIDRVELGLPSESRARPWPAKGAVCDQAAAFYDPDRTAPGTLSEQINVEISERACTKDVSESKPSPRSHYQLGRVFLAKGDAKSARQQFEIAISSGYRAARVDLADLLLNESSGTPDAGRAVSLYEQAWQAGVPIAAFKLGHFFEQRAQGHPDSAKSWAWYQLGADAGEPNALARFAEREDVADQTDPSTRDAQMLGAFKFYAAAAERAHAEVWPDDAWRNWRYRRATLARRLAAEGMMRQTAAAYSAVLAQWADRRP